MTWDDYGRLGMLYNSTVGINSYQYDTNGLRTFKRAKNVNHYYYYDGDRLIAEKLTTGYLLFHYDENDSIFAITYNNGTSEYTYQLLKNLQGDVVAILNAANSVIHIVNSIHNNQRTYSRINLQCSTIYKFNVER